MIGDEPTSRPGQNRAQDNARQPSRPRAMPRRRFLGISAAALGATVFDRAAAQPIGPELPLVNAHPVPQAPAAHASFDPWIEIIGDAFRHNVREAARLAGGRPILAVVKNNAYGLGDTAVGPLLASCPEVAGLACVRVAEAVAMREAGVTKPILNMAEVTEQETEVLVRHNVTSSLWLDDAPARMNRVARKLGRPVPVELYIDAGMGREGMPDYRARPWLDTLCRQASVRVEGTYMMFAHVREYGPEQLARFLGLVRDARASGLQLGRLHAAPTFELFLLPESHLDLVRPGNTLFGNYPGAEGVREQADLKSVFRLRSRIVRLEQLRAGDSASFRREYIATKPTWIALLPVGHTDGYPSTASGTCQVLIRDRLYPVVAVVSSAHTVVEIGDEKTVEVGDVATLIGPDHAEIDPQAIAEKTGVRFLTLITKLNARMPRYVV